MHYTFVLTTTSLWGSVWQPLKARSKQPCKHEVLTSDKVRPVPTDQVKSGKSKSWSVLVAGSNYLPWHVQPQAGHVMVRVTEQRQPWRHYLSKTRETPKAAVSIISHKSITSLLTHRSERPLFALSDLDSEEEAQIWRQSKTQKGQHCVSHTDM